MTGDFIPFFDAPWKQIYVNTGLTTAENYNEGWTFGVNLDNCVVVVVSNLTAGSAILMCKLIQPNIVQLNTPVSSKSSDIAEGAELLQEGMYNKRAIQALVPLSSARGAQSPMINLGNVKAGQVFTWDWTSLTTLAGSIMFVITGKVAKSYYSTGAKFMHSPNTFNFNEQLLSGVMNLS